MDDPGTPSPTSSVASDNAANRFDQGATSSYAPSQIQTPEGGSPDTDTTSDFVDSASDRDSSPPEADQPDERLAARRAVIARAEANQQLELRELDVFLRQEKRAAAEKGTGSRGGVDGHYCEYKGCSQPRVKIPRHDRALHHVAKHFGLKPFQCAQWSVFDRVNLYLSPTNPPHHSAISDSCVVTTRIAIRDPVTAILRQPTI
jgi:hypothetical protein